MAKDKSLKNEFEKKFEEQQHADRPVDAPGPARGDREYRDDVRQRGEAGYRDDVRDRREPGYREVKSETIPIIQEQVHVGKRVVETGKILVSKSVHEEEVTIDLPTVEEEVDVERVPVNEYVETMPPPLFAMRAI